MKHLDFEIWLAGQPGAPLVPSTWSSGPIWEAKIFEVDSRGQESTRVVTATEAVLNQLSGRSKKSLDVAASAENIVRAISNMQPEWLEESCLQLQDEELSVADLPLFAGTRSVLQSLNFQSSASINTIAEISRGSFMTVKDGAAALLDLTIAVEHWWPWRLYAPIWHAREVNTLEQVARAIIEEYASQLGSHLEGVWVEAVLARQSWGVPKSTLQEIGDQVGVTRERVRQILARFDVLVGQRVWPIPSLLAEVVLTIAQGDPETVPTAIKSNGYGADDDWTAEEIAVLLEWFGHDQLSAELRISWEKADMVARVTPEDAKAVRASRSALGFLNTMTVTSTDGSFMDPSRVCKIANQLYPRTFQQGNWLLVGTRNSTMAEGTVSRQLCANHTQSTEEIIEGLERRRRARQADQLPPPDVITSLLSQSGCLENENGLWTGQITPPEPGSIEAWLLKTIHAAEGGVLHRDVILRRGQDDGLNLVSLHQFLSYSPIVRNIDASPLLRLAGRSVDPSAADFALRVAEAVRIATEAEWSQVDPQTIELTVVVGTSLMSSSILNVDAALAGLWPEGGAEIECLCDRSFEGRINRYGLGNQLIGWMTLLSHLNQEHGFREGDSLTVRVSTGVLRIVAIT